MMDIAEEIGDTSQGLAGTGPTSSGPPSVLTAEQTTGNAPSIPPAQPASRERPPSQGSAPETAASTDTVAIAPLAPATLRSPRTESDTPARERIFAASASAG